MQFYLTKTDKPTQSDAHGQRVNQSGYWDDQRCPYMVANYTYLVLLIDSNRLIDSFNMALNHISRHVETADSCKPHCTLTSIMF